MKRFLTYLKSRPLGIVSVALLALLYFVMLFAEFFAPYGPNTSFPEYTYHPPNARFYQGRIQAQRCEVINSVNWSYARVRGEYQRVKLFAKAEPYKLWGLIPMERRLFTVGITSKTNESEVTSKEGELDSEFKSGAYPLFLMGADHLGRDLFSRIIYGSRISLTIGFIATAISLLLAMIFGGLSGYFGGKTDWTIMRFAEFFMLIPGLYLILFLRSLLSDKMDPGQAYMMITIILSLVGWPGSARTIRGMVHAIKREEFVLNAQLEMIPSVVIIFKYIIPQIASLLIVSVALSVPTFIMTETILSYLGLGISDPAVSWGSLIKRDVSTITNLKAYPWLLNPVWFLLGVTLAFNFLGDSLRDFFDPYSVVFKKRFTRRRGGAALKKKAQGPGQGQGQGLGTRDQGLGSVVRKFCELLTKLRLPEKKSSIPHSPQSPVPSPQSPVPSPYLLDVKDLNVSFTLLQGRNRVSVKAVRGVSFTLNKGETLGIVGESGSGKSVSVQSIPGLLPGNAQASGEVYYNGTNILRASTEQLRQYRGKKIGMIFQEPGRSYDPLQNMGKVFLETFRNSEPGISKEDAAEKAQALLAEVGLPGGRERLSNFPHQFSGGQLQRISIALALAQNCELLIADEPTTALDVTIQRQIMDLLKHLRASRNLSIIFISHDIDLVADIADRIIVMYGGLVMESGYSAEITGSPIHPYTQALLSSSPRFGSHYTQGELRSIPGRVTNPATSEPRHLLDVGCPFAPRCAQAKPECKQQIPQLRIIEGREVRCQMGT